MSVNLYAKQPSNREEAKKRAKRLQKFLKKETNVKWKIRIHENMGWFYSCFYGTFSLCEHAASYGGGGYLLMNSASPNGAGFGDIRLTSKHFKKRSNVLSAIRLSLLEQKKLVEYYINGYLKNSKIKGFKPLK